MFLSIPEEDHPHMNGPTSLVKYICEVPFLFSFLKPLLWDPEGLRLYLSFLQPVLSYQVVIGLLRCPPSLGHALEKPTQRPGPGGILVRRLNHLWCEGVWGAWAPPLNLQHPAAPAETLKFWWVQSFIPLVTQRLEQRSTGKSKARFASQLSSLSTTHLHYYWCSTYPSANLSPHFLLFVNNTPKHLTPFAWGSNPLILKQHGYNPLYSLSQAMCLNVLTLILTTPRLEVETDGEMC